MASMSKPDGRWAVRRCDRLFLAGIVMGRGMDGCIHAHTLVGPTKEL